jgi:hypothetical protein
MATTFRGLYKVRARALHEACSSCRGWLSGPRRQWQGTLNLTSLLAVAWSNFELVDDFLASLELLEPVHHDASVMDEDVLAATIRQEEAKTFGGGEPLDRSTSHRSTFIRCGTVLWVERTSTPSSERQAESGRTLTRPLPDRVVAAVASEEKRLASWWS